MARAFSIAVPICIALAVSGPAWAGKPRIAVLGLEPLGPGGAVDPATQSVARAITRELRQRIQARTSPYETAPGSDKDLADEKLLMSCEPDAPDCMLVIGAGLASDVVLYGQVERRGGNFRVSLHLFDVKLRSLQSAADEMPVGAPASGVSRRLYRKLIGEPVVEDVAPVPEAPPPRRGSSSLWAWSLAGGVAIAVGGGAVAWYSNDRQQTEAGRVGVRVGDDHCNASDVMLLDEFSTKINLDAFRRACTWHDRTYYGYGTAFVGGALAVVSLIMMSRDPSPPDASAGGGKKPGIAIAPIVAPGLAGAQLTLDW